MSYIHSHWKLNELGGNAINARQPSGLFNLTQTGIVPSITGKLGLARGPFSATNYFFWNSSGSSTTIFDTNYFAMEFFIKTTGLSQDICGKRGGVSGWWVYVDGAGKIGFVCYGITGILSSVAINDGNWHHIFCICRAAGANEVRIYIDGSQSGTMQTGAVWTKDTGNFILGGNNVNLNFTGSLDSPAYWSIMPSTMAEVESILARRVNQGRGREYGYAPGYIQKSKIDSVSGNKLITATRLTCQDTTNQNPIVYQRNAVIT